MKRDARTRTSLFLALVLTLTLANPAFAQEGFDADLDELMSLEFSDSTVHTVLNAIGAAGEFEFVFDDRVDLDERVSVALSDVSVLNALRFVTRSNRLFYVLRDSRTVLIAPDTRQKRQEYMPVGTRTFEIKHADPKTVITVLRSLLQTRELVIDDQQNAITMKDTLDQLEIAQELIDRLERKSGDAADIRPVDREPFWIGSAYNQDLRTPGDSIPKLEVDMGQAVTFGPNDTTARLAYKALGDATGVQFVFEVSIDLSQPVPYVEAKMSAQEALDRVNQQLEKFSVVWGPRTIFIAPDISGRQEAEEHLAIQFFYLSHAEPRSVITALRSKLQSRQIVEIPRINTVAIKDNVANLRAAQELVERMDRADGSAPVM